MGGNLLTEVPDSVGNLSQLQGLILCDNLIENLPASIARLKHLKSLLLHRNRLKHLPRGIVSLRNLVELSLRENPLVVRFVQDITLNPSSLLELAARTVRSHSIAYGPADIPRQLAEYLQSAHCCVNPKCSGEWVGLCAIDIRTGTGRPILMRVGVVCVCLQAFSSTIALSTSSSSISAANTGCRCCSTSARPSEYCINVHAQPPD